MIDLHTHILPCIDDGASSVEEAIELTESLFQQNTRIAVCTPHFDPSQTALEEFLLKREKAMALMDASMVMLISASETMLHEYLFHYPDLSELCIGKTKYLLLELPFDRRWDKELYVKLNKITAYYNIIPVIAHIERYPSVKKSEKTIKKLIEMGCVIQLNTSSIIDRKTRSRSFRYMKKGYIDVLGSDCHNMNKRPPIITMALDNVTHKLGIEYRNRLMYNAECIMNGIEIKRKIVFIIE